ncbi:MAG: glycoside hydrolase family 2 protein [Clostridia bacterium]
MQNIQLSGEWLFKDDKNDCWLSAEAPCSQYGGLLKLGKIPDSFIGTNEKAVFWAGNSNWQFKKSFSIDETFLSYRKVEIVYDMLDTLCSVSINGEKAFSSSNMHLGGRFDIKKFLKVGDNEISIFFENPVAYIKKAQQLDKMPKNMNGLSGVSHIRKAQCHFGWDWGATLPVVGITRGIWLEAYNFAVSQINIHQLHEDNKVTLSVEVLSDTQNIPGTMLFLDLANPLGKVILNKAQALKNKNSFVFEVKNPELWWTNDLSDNDEQPLYEIRAYIVKDEKVEYKSFKYIGLRTIELCRDADEFGHQFQFKINGVPLFIKGANWIPPDCIIERFSADKLNYFINSVKYANMNMLRVWGGGYYESDAFYDACDRSGILVWQDFCFACAPYPFYNEPFLESVKNEVNYNVLRLKHHACLAVWSGNNEIEAMSLVWRSKRKLIEWTERFFYKLLPSQLAELDGVTPYIVGSPAGDSYLKNINSDGTGDTHLWHVWHGLRPLNYYQKRYTRFCSEFGLESLCDIKTISTFATEKDFSLNSEVLKAHQKCLSGNSKILFYMSTKFRLPKKFEDIVYLSQLVQNECVADATEHWRRNRGRCNGSMFWQLNDCWPVTSWSSIDYFGRYKALQYRARHFNAPQSVSILNTKNGAELYVINDKTTPLYGSLYCKLFSFDKTILFERTISFEVPKTSAKLVFPLDLKNKIKSCHANCALYVKLTNNDGKLLNEKTSLFMPEKNLALPNPHIKFETTFENGFALITLSAENYARFVKLDLLDSYKPFSDNFFDLFPGDKKTIAIEIPDGMLQDDFIKNLSVTSLYSVEPIGGRMHDFTIRQKIRFNPINIGQYIAYFFT